MVARGAGDVGCAHCTLIGADRACPVCTHLVCERCAADWASCTEPSGRIVRLGLSARVRDIDPGGGLAIVSHWLRHLRLFDLRRLRWISGAPVRASSGRLTGDGRVIFAEWTSTGDARQFEGMRVVDLRGAYERLLTAMEAPARGTAVTATSDIFYYVTETERVGILDGDTSYVVDPLPRKVVQAAYLDGERRLLAAASWSELVLGEVVEGAFAPRSHIKTETAGDVPWLAVAGPRLVAAVKQFGGASRVEVHRLEHGRTIGAVERALDVDALRAASLSRDGRYLAIGDGVELHVHALDTGESTTFTEHTDGINLVRFAGDDHLLISAHTDNRVVLRPRTPAGYARPLIAIDVPGDGVELTARPGTPAS